MLVDTILDEQQILSLIQQEIDWHEVHRGMKSKEFEEGFIAGLKQAQTSVRLTTAQIMLLNIEEAINSAY